MTWEHAWDLASDQRDGATKPISALLDDESRDLTECLADRSKNGWELVAASPAERKMFCLFWKRPASTDK